MRNLTSLVKSRKKPKVNETLEIRLVKEAVASTRLPQSVIFFTTHKCASTFMANFFRKIAQRSDYKTLNYASAIWQLGDQLDIGSQYEPFLENCYDLLYKKRGYIYAPQRCFFDFPGRQSFKHIFFLRDPRDVLVSAYYSFGFTHSTPKDDNHIKKFKERRSEIQNSGINNYALKASNEWLVPLYNSYRYLKETADNSLYLSYDEFKDNTKQFIGTIAEFLNVEILESEIKNLADVSSVNRKLDGRHLRSGESKQFITELDKNTLQYLNDNLSEILKYWGFDY